MASLVQILLILIFRLVVWGSCLGLVLYFGEVLIKGHASVEHLGLVFELLGVIIPYHFI